MIRFTLAVVLFSLFLIASSSALLFDFEDQKQLDKWEVLNNVGGKWEIINGTLKLTAPGVRWDFLTIKGIEFTDGTIQYKLKWLGGTYCEVGTAYRIQEGPDFSNYQIHISTVEPALRWAYCIQATGSGVWGPEIPRPPVNEWVKQPVDKWFEFKVEVKGDKHVVYAGPAGKMEKVAEVTEGKLKKGKIGIVGYSGMREETLIDDFEVNGTNIPSTAVDNRNKLIVTWCLIKTRY